MVCRQLQFEVDHAFILRPLERAWRAVLGKSVVDGARAVVAIQLALTVA